MIDQERHLWMQLVVAEAAVADERDKLPTQLLLDDEVMVSIRRELINNFGINFDQLEPEARDAVEAKLNYYKENGQSAQANQTRCMIDDACKSALNLLGRKE